MWDGQESDPQHARDQAGGTMQIPLELSASI